MRKLMPNIKIRLLLALTLAGLSSSCKNTTGSSDSVVKGNVSEGSDYLWPNARASVCWEFDIPKKDLDDLAQAREKVAQFATSEFAKAGFTLEGWGPCKPDSRGIRIAQWRPPGAEERLPDEDTGGIVKAFGRRLDGLYRGVGFSMSTKNCPGEGDCYLVYALHEIGHAVGLRHEANRADSVCSHDQTEGLGDYFEGGLPKGQYDRDSIMNYCYALPRGSIGSVVGLSPGDIATIKSYYSENPQFVRQDECRKDGHSWVSDATSSCCRLAPTIRKKEGASYPICEQETPQSGGDSQAKEPQGPQILPSSRFAVTVYVDVRANPPVTPGALILSCREGEYPVSAAGQSLASGILIGLTRAASESGDDTFTCTHLDIFEKNGTSYLASDATKMARLVFDAPRVVKSGQDLVVWDLTSGPWQTYPVRNGIPDAPHISPGPLSTGVVDPATGAPREATAIKRGVYFRILDLPPNSKVKSARLHCDKMQPLATAEIPEKDQKGNTKPWALVFALTVDPSKGPVSCTHLEFDLKIEPPTPPSSDSGSSTPPLVPISKTAAITFAAPLTIKSPNDYLAKQFKAPNCLDYEGPQPATSDEPREAVRDEPSKEPTESNLQR